MDRAVTIFDHRGQPVRLDRPDDLAVPQILTFTGIYQGAYQTYFREKFDEAMRHSRENALAMRLDEHLQACLNERIRGVSNLCWHLEPDSPKDPRQKAVADGCTRVLSSTPRFRRMRKQLMKALWFGRYGVQLKWRWQEMDLPLAQAAPVPMLAAPMPQQPPMPGAPDAGPPTERRKALTALHHVPVNGDKIGYTWDHVPMVQVYPGQSDRFPEHLLVTDNLSRSLVLRERAWREQFVLHTYDPDDPDFYYPDMADAVHGLGVRHWLYWSWWTKTEFAAAVADALERFGVGIIAIYYTAGNAEEEKAADKAAKNYSRRTVFKVPRPAGGKDSGGFEVVEIPSAGLQILQALRADCERREERFIIGQTGSSSSETSGLGTHDTSFMMQTKYDILKDDAEELAETLTGSEHEPGFVWMVQRYTYPWADFPLKLVFNVPDPGAEGRLGAATMVFNMGGKLKEEEVRGTAGFSEPGPEDATLVNPALAMPPAGTVQPGAPGTDPNAPTDPAQAALAGAAPPPMPQGEGDPDWSRLLEESAGGPQLYRRRGDPLTYAAEPISPTDVQSAKAHYPLLHDRPGYTRDTHFIEQAKALHRHFETLPGLARWVTDTHGLRAKPLPDAYLPAPGDWDDLHTFARAASSYPHLLGHLDDLGNKYGSDAVHVLGEAARQNQRQQYPALTLPGGGSPGAVSQDTRTVPLEQAPRRAGRVTQLPPPALEPKPRPAGKVSQDRSVIPLQPKPRRGKVTDTTQPPALEFERLQPSLNYASPRAGPAAPPAGSGGSFAPPGQGVRSPKLETSNAAPKSQLSPGTGVPPVAQVPPVQPGQLGQHLQAGGDLRHVFEEGFDWSRAKQRDHSALRSHLQDLSPSRRWEAIHDLAGAAAGGSPHAQHALDFAHAALAMEARRNAIPVQDYNRAFAHALDTQGMDPGQLKALRKVLRPFPKVHGQPGGVFLPPGMSRESLQALAGEGADVSSLRRLDRPDPHAEAARRIATLLPRPEHLAQAARGKAQAGRIDRNLQEAVHLALGGEGGGWEYTAKKGPADLRHRGMTHASGATVRPELDVKHVSNLRGVVGGRQDNVRNKLAEAAEDPGRLKASLAFRLGQDVPEHERGAYLKHGVGGFTARPGQPGVERVLTHQEVQAMGTPEGARAASKKIHAALKNADLEGYHADLEKSRARMAVADGRNAMKTLRALGGNLADGFERMFGARLPEKLVKQIRKAHGYARAGAPLAYGLALDAPTAAGVAPPPGRAMHPEGQAALAHFKVHLDAHAKKLAPGQADHYHAAAAAVIGRMTPKAADRYRAAVSAHEFHQSPGLLTRHLAGQSGKIKRHYDRGGEIGGAFFNETGRLVLDGGFALEGKQLPTAGVYAHEMGHAIDGRAGARISDSPEWQRAWQNELQDGRISKYAGTSPAEGFAEFSRLVHSTRLAPEQLAAKYPQAAAVWQKEGLLHNETGPPRTVQPRD